MKIKVLLAMLLSSTGGVFSAPEAYANYIPKTYIWDNFKGFLPLGDCRPETKKSIDFWATIPTSGNSFFEPMLDGDGKEAAKVALGTLVKYVNGPALKTARASEYGHVRVVGVPSNALTPATGRLAIKPKKGFIRRQAVQDLRYFSIVMTGEINMNIDDGQGNISYAPPLSYIGDSPVPVTGSQWVIESGPEGYSTYTCQEGPEQATYMVFDVFGPSDLRHQTVGARVLVNRDRTRIFNEIQVYQTESAFRPQVHAVAPIEQLITKVVTPPTPEVVGPVGPWPVTKPPEIIAKQLAYAALQNSRFGGELVICISDDSMKARGDPLSDKTFETFFPAIRYELVKLVNGAEKNLRKKTIGSKVYEFVELEFPDHKKATEKKGWVAVDFVVKRERCQGYSQKSWAAAKEAVLAEQGEGSGAVPKNNSKPRRNMKDDRVGRCAKFIMDTDGTMGKYGQAAYDLMNSKANKPYFTKKNALSCYCPNFNRMSDSEKLAAWTYFWTASASLEAGGTKGTDGVFCSPSVPHTITPKTGIGFLAMELGAQWREGRAPECRGSESFIKKGENQMRCSVTIMRDTYLKEGDGVCSNPGYWSTINKPKPLLKVMEHYKPCGVVIKK